MKKFKITAMGRNTQNLLWIILAVPVGRVFRTGIVNLVGELTKKEQETMEIELNTEEQAQVKWSDD